MNILIIIQLMKSLDVALSLINNGILSMFIQRDDDYSDEIERWVEFDDGDIDVKEVANLIIQNLDAANIYEVTNDIIIIDFNHRRIAIHILLDYVFEIFHSNITFI